MEQTLEQLLNNLILDEGILGTLGLGKTGGYQIPPKIWDSSYRAMEGWINAIDTNMIDSVRKILITLEKTARGDPQTATVLKKIADDLRSKDKNRIVAAFRNIADHAIQAKQQHSMRRQTSAPALRREDKNFEQKLDEALSSI